MVAISAALQQTHLFEKGLSLKLISKAFEPHLGCFVKAHEQTLQRWQGNLRLPSIISSSDFEADGRLTSAVDLFRLLKSMLEEIAVLSTGKVLVQLGGLFDTQLVAYAKYLESIISFEEPKRKVKNDQLKIATLCALLATVLYCHRQTVSLEQRLCNASLAASVQQFLQLSAMAQSRLNRLSILQFEPIWKEIR